MDKPGWSAWIALGGTILAALIAGIFLIWNTRHERPHDRLKTYVEIYNALPDDKGVKDKLWDEIELRLSLLTDRPAEKQSAPIQDDLRRSTTWWAVSKSSPFLYAGILFVALREIGFISGVVADLTILLAVVAGLVGVPVVSSYLGRRRQVEEEVVVATQIDSVRDRVTKLEDSYASYLRGLGHDVQVNPQFRDATGTRYRPDLFDATSNEVIEIKVNPARSGTHRLQHALEQLRHYQEVTGATKATLLVDEQPREAFLDLIEREGFRVIWPEGEGFSGSPEGGELEG